MFDPLTADELKALGLDILKNGLLNSIVIFCDTDGTYSTYKVSLLDGYNRVVALERVGVAFELCLNGTNWSLRVTDSHGPLAGKDLPPPKVLSAEDTNPFDYAISANLHRRHVDAEGKRKLIVEVLTADPTKSDRAIAAMLKASPTTVGTVRRRMNPTVQSGQLAKRIGKDGKSRRQPARKTAGAANKTKSPIKTKTIKAAGAVVANNAAIIPEIGPVFDMTAGAAKLGAQTKASDSVLSSNSRDEIGPGDLAGKDALIDHLRAEKRQLEIRITGLESEIAELRNMLNGNAVDDETQLLRGWDRASEGVREKFLARNSLQRASPSIANKHLKLGHDAETETSTPPTTH
jgi:hypothetical protein